MEVYHSAIVALYHHPLILDDVVLVIEGDDVRYSEGLAGHAELIAVLKSDVRNGGIADDNLGCRSWKPQQLRLIVTHDQVSGGGRHTSQCNEGRICDATNQLGRRCGSSGSSEHSTS